MSWLTKLATAAVQRQNDRLIQAGLKAVSLMTAVRAENRHLKAQLEVAANRRAELERQLAAAKIKVQDLRAERRRWLGHYDVCERAQAVAEEDERKRVSNR